MCACVFVPPRPTPHSQPHLHRLFSPTHTPRMANLSSKRRDGPADEYHRACGRYVDRSTFWKPGAVTVSAVPPPPGRERSCQITDAPGAGAGAVVIFLLGLFYEIWYQQLQLRGWTNGGISLSVRMYVYVSKEGRTHGISWRYCLCSMKGSRRHSEIFRKEQYYSVR